jgi:hypothetical protein
MRDHFEYDEHQGEFKEKPKRLYSYQTPVVKTQGGDYRIGAEIVEEVAHVQHRFRDMEPYKRNDDTYTVRKAFNNQHKTGIHGRAKHMVSIGPWISLRFMNSTIHITVTGTPPRMAYEILGKHFAEQLKASENPRLLMPIKVNKTQKRMKVLAKADRLKNIGINELVGLFVKHLKQTKHLIYRQNNAGGPLWNRSKDIESLF